MRCVFATFNAGKVREVRDLLAGLPLDLVGPADLGIEALAEETGVTFRDNAILKASDVFSRTGLPAFADDSGLEVAALGGRPGVYSARFAGEGHDDGANISKLLGLLHGVDDRRARFVCHAVLVFEPEAIAFHGGLPEGVLRIDGHPLAPPGAGVIAAEGEVRGTIIDDPRGHDGFGYDPVFYREDLGRTFAQLGRDEKNALSHRGQAFRRLRAAVERGLG